MEKGELPAFGMAHLISTALTVAVQAHKHIIVALPDYGMTYNSAKLNPPVLTVLLPALN